MNKIRRLVKSHEIMAMMVIVAVILSLSILSFVVFQSSMKTAVQERTEVTLKDYTRQSAALLESVLDGYFQRLDAISHVYQKTPNVEYDEMAQMFIPIDSVDGEVGVISQDGILYTADKNQFDVASAPYFKKSMNGERAITFVGRSAGTNKPIVVMSQPLMRGDNVTGVICTKVDRENLEKKMGKVLSEDGYSTVIIEKNGAIISGYEGIKNAQDYFVTHQGSRFLNGYSVTSFKDAVRSEKIGLISYYRNNLVSSEYKQYIYHMPVVEDWRIITVASAEIIDGQYKGFSAKSFLLMFINFVLYGILFTGIYWLTKGYQSEMELNQRDPLTNLANKKQTKIKMERYLSREGINRKCACVFIDVDDFKNINDKYGHQRGDEILLTFAHKLQDSFRQEDIIARFGGDEFCIWMKDITSRDSAMRKVDSLVKAVRADENLAITVSVGAACYPDDAQTYNELMECADSALYYAKQHGKNRFCFYKRNHV